MKKISLFLAAAILFCGTASAQLQKGQMMVGGDIGNLKLGLNKGNGYSIDVNAYQAWFLRDNFALGYKVKIGVSGSKYERIDRGYESNNAYAFDAFGRYYFHKPSVDLLKHACFFAEGTAGLEENCYGDYFTSGFGFGVGSGVSYFITPNVSLEGMVKYNGLVGRGYRYPDPNKTYTGNMIGTSYENSLSVNIGCALFLPNHKLRDVLRHKQRG